MITQREEDIILVKNMEINALREEIKVLNKELFLAKKKNKEQLDRLTSYLKLMKDEL